MHDSDFCHSGLGGGGGGQVMTSTEATYYCTFDHETSSGSLFAELLSTIVWKNGSFFALRFVVVDFTFLVMYYD